MFRDYVQVDSFRYLSRSKTNTLESKQTSTIINRNPISGMRKGKEGFLLLLWEFESPKWLYIYCNCFYIYKYISYIIRGPSSKLRMTIPFPTVHIITYYINYNRYDIWWIDWLICYIFLKLQLTSSQEPVDQCLPAGQVLEGLGDLEGPDPKAIQRVLCIYIYIFFLSVQFCHVFLAVENMILHICLKFKSTKYTSFSHIYICIYIYVCVFASNPWQPPRSRTIGGWNVSKRFWNPKKQDNINQNLSDLFPQVCKTTLTPQTSLAKLSRTKFANSSVYSADARMEDPPDLGRFDMNEMTGTSDWVRGQGDNLKYPMIKMGHTRILPVESLFLFTITNPEPRADSASSFRCSAGM